MSQPGHDFWDVPEPLFVSRTGLAAGEPMRTSTPSVGEEGRQSFLASIFAQMAGGVVVSAAAAALVAMDANVATALAGPSGMTTLGWVVAIAPLGLVLLLGGMVERLSGPAARAIFFTYAGLVGLSLGTVFLGLATSSVVGTFLATAAGFAALALIGGRTHRDLSGFGNFLVIALVGLVVAMLANLFIRSVHLDLGLAAIGILLFAGLTAFDTQRLKRLYDDQAPSAGGSIAVLGALTLYLDFINLFVSLLRFTGRRR